MCRSIWTSRVRRWAADRSFAVGRNRSIIHDVWGEPYMHWGALSFAGFRTETWRRHSCLPAPRLFSALFVLDEEARQERRARQAEACATSGRRQAAAKLTPPGRTHWSPRTPQQAAGTASQRYLASRQLSPTPTSTSSGTLRSQTPSISRFTSAGTLSHSSGGHSKTNSSCTCNSMALR